MDISTITMDPEEEDYDVVPDLVVDVIVNDDDVVLFVVSKAGFSQRKNPLIDWDDDDSSVTNTNPEVDEY
jgi:hypothetical protein